MMKLRNLLFLIFCLLWIGCETSNDSINLLIAQTESIDSAKMLFEQNVSHATAFEYHKHIKKLCQQNRDTPLSNRYLDVLFQIAKRENDIYIRNLGEQCKTFQQFILGDANNTRYWSQKMLKSTKEDPQIDELDVYHLAGIAYYIPPSNTDSTLKYWKLGFQKAVEKKDDYRIYFFANNLGSIFYELEMHVISREFFLKALSQAQINNTVSPVLINNILNTLIKVESFAEAGNFYRKHQQAFEVNPTDLQNQSIYLNSIFINQRMKNYQKSDSLIRLLPVKMVHPTLRASYTSLQIRQFIATGNKEFINEEVRRESENHGIKLLQNLARQVNVLDLPELEFLWNSIEKDVNQRIENKDYKRSNSRQLLFALDLLMHKYQNKSLKKYQIYQLAHSDIARIALENDLELNHYVTEVQRVQDLFDKLISRNKELDYQRDSKNKLLLLAILLVIILVISGLYYRKKIQLRQHEEESLKKDKDLLLREKAMNQRMVAFSKEMMDFTKKIKSELDQMNLNDDNTNFLRKFRSELLGFITINLEENPKAVDYNLDKNVIENSIPEEIWSQLNKTEKRVYTLFKDGFKPSEIGGMLGVSTQHVYNLKNKLKRKGINIDSL